MEIFISVQFDNCLKLDCNKIYKGVTGDTMIKIVEYSGSYQDQTVQHILDIENNEFFLNVNLEDQPDLISIEESYQKPGGNFWIALDDKDGIVGTIALFNLGNNFGDLRKLFVKPHYRGEHVGLSEKLLRVLLDWAILNKYKKIYLETTSKFSAAINFYKKHRFEQINVDDLPENFPKIRLAELFFVFDMINK
jgi:N-acetylglutamate synthase-like GNAT family acetyltransferase